MAQGNLQSTFWPALGLALLGACVQAQQTSPTTQDPQGQPTTQLPPGTEPGGQNGNGTDANAVPDVRPNPGLGNNPNGLPTTPNTVVVSPNLVVPLPQGANVRFVGRFDAETDVEGPMMAWPGSQIVVGFSGTQLTVELLEVDRATYNGLSVNNYVSIVNETGASSRIRLSSSAQSYLVARDLPPGQHQVVLTKLTEAQIGRVQFLGATTDGALTHTTASPNRRLEFIGDSGTAGYGAIGASPCAFSPATEDASVAYPAVVGALLNAQVHNISFSGKGIVQNRDMVRDNYKTLPILWGRTLPGDQNELAWEPDGWQPQAVVMTIGGNDFFSGVLSQSVFNGRVVAFIKQVQALYPGTHVYLGLSPMLRNDANPNQRETALSYAQAAVASLADSRVHFIDLPRDLGANGYGCDQHMTAGTHRVTAQAVAQVLKAQLGW